VNPRARHPVQSPDEPTSVLLASPYPDDHLLLPGILSHIHWRWHKSHRCQQALGLLHDNKVAVVLCERDQPDGCWQDLLEGAAALVAPPSLIVCSRLADEQLWAEVLNLGGYDVLVKPFDHEEVLRVAFLAWHSWKRLAGDVPAPKPASGGNPGSVSTAGQPRSATKSCPDRIVPPSTSESNGNWGVERLEPRRPQLHLARAGSAHCG